MRSQLQVFLEKAEWKEPFSIRDAEQFVAHATALLGSRWNAYADATRDPSAQRSKVSKRLYEEAQRVHDLAHQVLTEAKAKRCGRCKHWAKRPNYMGCSAFKTGFSSDQRWMFTKDGPPWNDCRRFEPTPEALG